MKFSELSLHPDLAEAIGYMGFEEATPIQSQAIPIIKDNKDIIACAQTGTGKTGAFLIPVIDKIMRQEGNKIKALVVVPTRELAIQIDQQIDGLSYGCGISSMALYGGGDGDDWSAQKKAILEGVDILVATPGKLISHLNLGYVDFSALSFLVLDEADRMLDIGFFDDILKIVSFLPKERQNLMFSATMPPKIRDLSKRILNSPEEISIAISKPAEGVLQASYLVYDENKIPLICELIKGKEEYKSIIIFSSTKKQVSSIVRYLNKHNIAAKGISSDLEQEAREQVLLDFRNKKVRVLVATDVISRGIDIKDINLVINYSVPSDAEDYVHRIGRTARADTTGVAITLINNDDMFSFKKIEDLIEKEVVKIPTPSSIGDSPEWKVPERRHNKKRHFNKKKGNFRRKKS